MNTAATTCARILVALDIDGTLIDSDRRIPSGTVEALDLVRAAGHEVILATGRSAADRDPAGTDDRMGGVLRLSLTIHLDQTAPSGYDVVEARSFDPGPVIRRALDVAPSVRVAIEEIGWGWRTSSPFEPGELNGQQKTVLLSDLMAEPATRIALTAPDIRRYADTLRATGVTATPQGADWLDVTAPGVNT